LATVSVQKPSLMPYGRLWQSWLVGKGLISSSVVNGSTIGGGASGVEGRLKFCGSLRRIQCTVVNVMVTIGGRAYCNWFGSGHVSLY